MNQKKVNLPLSQEVLLELRAGEEVILGGTVYTARDAAHKRLVELIRTKKKLPFSLEGESIYYTAPTPPQKDFPFGSCGPTTSRRMDPYTPLLLRKGLKVMIGKGEREEGVKKAIKKYKAIYFLTWGGAGALLGKKIKRAEPVAFPELGPEAIWKLWIEDFPALVGIDSRGEDIFKKRNL